MKKDERECPECGAIAHADFVDIGVGEQQCGPFVCDACGWIEKQASLADIFGDRK